MYKASTHRLTSCVWHKIWVEIHEQILFARFQSHFQIFDICTLTLKAGWGWVNGGWWVVSKWEHKVPSKFCQSVRHSWQRFAFIATLVRNCFSTFYSTKKPFYFAVKCSMYICTSQPPRPSPSVWNWRWRWYHSHNHTHPPNFSGSRATARTRSRPLNKCSAVCCEKKLFDSSSCCLRLPNFQPPVGSTQLLPPKKRHPQPTPV